MKRIFKIFVILLILCGIAYPWRQRIQELAGPFFTTKAEQAVFLFYSLERAWTNVVAPCEAPITYSLGIFDSRFRISEKYYLSALADAEGVWEKAIGKELFSHVPQDGTVTMNLVYDYRQNATQQLSRLGIVVQDDEASYNALKKKYDALDREYVTLKTAYETRVRASHARSQKYQADVDAWNAKGGAPSEEYEALQAEYAQLQRESAALNEMLKKLNTMITEINALAATLNRLVATLNLNVQQYNTVGATRGDAFEEGLYKRNETGESIDIYEFSSRAKLVRVLAHEFGHALGLEHSEDPNGIMYKMNRGTSGAPTASDVAALKAHCHIQ